MTIQLFSALIAFAFVSSITPGPNNLLLMASGANFGFRRTIPHMLGIGIGLSIMIVLVGVGLVQVFDRFPVAYTVLKVISVIYLCWLAWKIARAGAPTGKQVGGTPMTFTKAALFQWVNPKAWAMSLTAITNYTPDHHAASVLMVALAFWMVNLPSVSTWTVLGQQIRRVLTNPQHLQAFNLTMAALLVASLLPVLVH